MAFGLPFRAVFIVFLMGLNGVSVLGRRTRPLHSHSVS